MMGKGLLAGFLILLAGLACLAQAPQSNFPPGTFQSRAAIDGVVAAGYTGPGDIATFTAWYGMRAFSTATRGTNAVRVCDQATGAVCSDFVSDATTGALVVGTIGGSSCAVIACVIATLYDQSGSLACVGGTACDLVQATNASRYAFTVNQINTSYCAVAAGSLGMSAAAALTSTINQPYSGIYVASRAGSSSYRSVLGNTANTKSFGSDTTANNALVYTGATITAIASATDNAMHGLVMVANGASSSITVDGSTTSGLDTGAGNFAGTLVTGAGSLGAWVGPICEMGLIPSNIASSASALNTNMHGAYGSW